MRILCEKDNDQLINICIFIKQKSPTFVGGWVELDYKRNRKECKTIELSSKEVFGTLINIIIRLGTQSGGINLS